MLLISRFKIQGHSMEPTILDGEAVLVSSIRYLFSKPKVGDIVVVKYSGNRHSGLSRISYHGWRFWSRFAPQNDGDNNKYLVKRIAKVDGDKYFVKGDNEKDSMDSKEFGWIDKKEIVGKAIYRLSS